MKDILQVLTLILIAIGGFGLVLLKAGIETTAEKVVKVTIEKLRWPGNFRRPEASKDKSYGALWQELRPLTIYDDTAINKQLKGPLEHCSGWADV
jgi:hypothetical protein